MVSRLIQEKVQLKTLQRYHNQYLNNFGEHETLIEGIGSRPGFLGANPIAFLSLIARRPNFKLKDLEEALMIDKSLIRTTLFRGTLFLVPTEDFPVYHRAYRQFFLTRNMEKLRELGICESKLIGIQETLYEKMPDFPLKPHEIFKIIFSSYPKKPDELTCNLVLQKLCDIGTLVKANIKGWKSNDFSYALFDRWLTASLLRTENPETARTEVVRKYLKAYGPVSVEDLIWWTGLPPAQVNRALLNLKREIMRFNVESYKEDMIGPRDSLDAIRKVDEMQDSIHLLPPWDPYILGWRCRKRIADQEILPFVYDGRGNSTSVITDSGKVIGLWQFRDAAVNIVEFYIFPPYLNRKKAVLQKINEWSLAMLELTGVTDINIIEKSLIDPLYKRPPGSFLWPLGKPVIESRSSSSKVFLESPMERRNANTFRRPYLDNEFIIKSDF